MKILVLAPRFPFPLEKGDKLRMYWHIRELSKYHEIVLCALTESQTSEADLAELRKFCSRIYCFPRNKWVILKNLVLGLFTGMPLQVAWFFDQNIRRKILGLIQQEQPDHIYGQLIRTAPYLEGVSTPKTIDYMDNFSAWTSNLARHSRLPFMKWFYRMEAGRVARYEQSVFSLFDRHTIISVQDRDRFDFPDKHLIKCIPNGVDTDYFKPLERRKNVDIVFVGNLGYSSNVEASKFLVQQVMPFVWAKYPGMQVMLAGARPHAQVKALAGDRVKVTGWVADIREAYASATIFAAPIFLGVGLQNKILEAMSMGLACVTTPQVNGAVGAEPDQSVLIAETAAGFAEKIIQLKENEVFKNSLAQAGLDFVRSNYSWERAVYELHQTFFENIRFITKKKSV